MRKTQEWNHAYQKGIPFEYPKIQSPTGRRATYVARQDKELKDKAYLSIRLEIWLCGMGLLFFVTLFFSALLPKNRMEWVVLAFLFLLFLFGFYGGYQWIWKPYRKNCSLFHRLQEGTMAEDLYRREVQFSPEMEEFYHRMIQLLDKAEQLRSAMKQSEFLALQNQINPHFLYNTLEGIRSEALCAGIDSVAEMTEALATFFRYTISNMDRLVTLEDELANIENYYLIQQYRFGDRLNLSVEYVDEENMDVLDYRLPKLTLQPLVENAIYHGLESKVGKGELKVRIETTENRLILTVSDNGMGMDIAKLKLLNDKLRTTTIDNTRTEKNKNGGIAITNVNNRIKLLFGDEYGLFIYSTPDVGTDVELTLPIVKE